LIANWLLTALVKIVTTYTQPGQRVLLLAAPRSLNGAARSSSTPVRNGPDRDRYDGLFEASWTVARLGRSVQTRTAQAATDRFGYTLATAETGSESEPGLDAGPTRNNQSGLAGANQSGPRPAPVGHGRDRFDLIIVAAEQRALDIVRPTDWAGQLTQTGILAVVTHGDSARGQFADPADALSAAAHGTGLRYLDRIALLTAPIRDSVLAATGSGAAGRSSARRSTFGLSSRHLPVHDDLFVFTHVPAAAATVGGAAGDEETSDD
jgi:hypothetical protein